MRISDQLIQKYSVSGPRYTSYPTAPVWRDLEVGEQAAWLASLAESPKPLALYLHIPFCWARCTYCGCNTLITKQQERSGVYVEYLLKELDALASIQGRRKKIRQLHFGGGTPTFMLDAEFNALMERIHQHFDFEEDAEIAIEVDPASTRPGQIAFLAGLGFNRLSLGVQDFDPKVQEVVNRIQSKEITRQHLEEARAHGFSGVNFDLIYGLPYQTEASFEQTIQEVISMRPDRLAVYNFAYLPEQLAHQRKIDPGSLPNEATKLNLLFGAIAAFCQNGYRYIGMDHFALESDELAKAQTGRSLYRNFMGYTAKSGVDLLGVGCSAIAEFGPHFVQNEKNVASYQDLVGQGHWAGKKGIRLNRDDEMRKWTIIRLICHFYLSFHEFQQAFGQSFKRTFEAEMKELEDLESDGLLAVTPEGIQVLEPGKILVRNICMKFDAYLKKPDAPKVKYSKTI